jgi:putative lipoprotein
MKNKYLTLGLTLLILIASAFAMGCTENTSESVTDGVDAGEPALEGDGVQGNIIFDEPVESFSNATIYLKVEDVSLQDVASVTMSENSIIGVSMDADNVQPVPYQINHPELEERMTYFLSVHVDVDGDGKLSNGDYYSPMHNPVPTEPGIHDLDVHVEMI